MDNCFCLGGCRREYSAPYEELKKQMPRGDSALPSEAELYQTGDYAVADASAGGGINSKQMVN